jgi:sodium-dependent dicarboxylate transporter 2/3/5
MRPSAIVLMVAVLHLVLSSNTVTGSIVIPLLISIAGMLHIPPWQLCAPAALTVPLALILPIESPDALIAYSSGYFSVKDMAKAGIPITLCAAAIIGLVLNVVHLR